MSEELKEIVEDSETVTVTEKETTPEDVADRVAAAEPEAQPKPEPEVGPGLYERGPECCDDTHGHAADGIDVVDDDGKIADSCDRDDCAASIAVESYDPVRAMNLGSLVAALIARGDFNLNNMKDRERLLVYAEDIADDIQKRCPSY